MLTRKEVIVARELLRAAREILAMEFNTRREFETYRKQHKMRPTTRVVIKEEERQKKVSGAAQKPPAFIPTDGKSFHDVMKKAKESQPPDKRWRVDLHDKEHYSTCQNYTTPKGSCVAIEKGGNIISVCKHSKSDERGSHLLQFAVQHGGNRLDAFGKELFSFYTRNGFEPVSVTKFNPEYAPEGWTPGRDAKEDIVFYRYTGAPYTEKTYDEFIKTTPYQDYEEAAKTRDKKIEENRK